MIKLENAMKNYNQFQLNCSMEVLPGRITGLIGSNGAGKSTTFKMILGLVKPDGGEIRVFDKEPSKLTGSEREDIGICMADSFYSSSLTLKEIERILKATYSKFDKDFFEEQCRRMRLPFDKQIKDFSTGMKAKTKMLCAMSHGAKILILDEPTSGLDVTAREDILELLREYMEQNEENSILISSHISSDLEKLCDDLYMIHDGRIVLHEETDVLLSDYAIIKISKKDYESLDRRYVLRVCDENYGYSCLTKEKQYYLENYPKLIVESIGIDDIIMTMVKGVTL